MRQAYTDTGWLLTEDGKLLGMALGFDFCSEHEWGCGYIKEQLGIGQHEFPIGVEDRTMTLVPRHLVFAKHDWRSKDKRFKKTVPAAILHCSQAYDYSFQMNEAGAPKSGAAHVKFLHMEFAWDCLRDASSKWFKPERDNMMVKWGSTDGFAIHVRGQENVERLEQLYQAFTACNVSVADPSIVGFLRRSMAFVIADAVPQLMRDQVRERDLAHKRLHDAMDATGIRTKLTAAGLRWYALRPDWRDEEGSELLVFLNPQEQTKYQHGWFTIAELEQWAAGTGPVLLDKRLEALLKEADVDLAYHLIGGFQECDIHLRVHPRPVWADEAKTEPALSLLFSKKGNVRMDDGVYTLSALGGYLERGRKQHAAEKAAYETKKAAESAAQNAAVA